MEDSVYKKYGLIGSPVLQFLLENRSWLLHLSSNETILWRCTSDCKVIILATKKKERPQKLVQKWQPRGQPVEVTEPLPSVVPRNSTRIINNGTIAKETTSGSHKSIYSSSKGSSLKVKHEDKWKGIKSFLKLYIWCRVGLFLVWHFKVKPTQRKTVNFFSSIPSQVKPNC